ncbi:MAG TPA: hypothetical protein VL463_17755, partial [Kofleriaceae bacterium]|nr:hypothetical protein [Kofleriaceae bacterium]
MQSEAPMVKQSKQGGQTQIAKGAGAPTGVPGKQTLTGQLAMAPAAVTPEAIFDDAAQHLAAAGHHLQQDVTRWNVGLDVLSTGIVRAAGEQAMTDFLGVLRYAATLRGSPMDEAAQAALESARELVAQLGLFRFQGHAVVARDVKIEDTHALLHIQDQIARAERCIDDAIRLFDLCQGGKVAGVKLDPAVRLEVGQLLADHATNDEETRWLEAFMRATNIRHTVFSMGGDRDAENLALKEVQVQADEQYFATKQNGHDFDAAEMAAIDDDAAQIELFIRNDAYGWRYHQVLRKYEPAKRLYLVQLLNHRHQLENMVHRGGGDTAIALIRECPGLGQWEYEYSKVTEKSTWDKVDDSVGEMVSELPGAALEFAGGVYHEMGHLPAIGPVFERAGKSFDDLAKVTDDAIGV